PTIAPTFPPPITATDPTTVSAIADTQVEAGTAAITTGNQAPPAGLRSLNSLKPKQLLQRAITIQTPAQMRHLHATQLTDPGNQQLLRTDQIQLTRFGHPSRTQVPTVVRQRTHHFYRFLIKIHIQVTVN